MGYNRLPSMRHYWSREPDLSVPFVSYRPIMTCASLDFANNECQPARDSLKQSESNVGQIDEIACSNKVIPM